MEQSSQQTAQKPKIPKKTKIAAYTLILCGIVYLLFGCELIYSVIRFPKSIVGYTEPLLFLLIGGSLSCVFSFFLLKRKKWAWVAVLVLLLLVGSIYSFFFAIIPFITPGGYGGSRDFMWVLFFCTLSVWSFISFILLLLDRKNFFKIAS